MSYRVEMHATGCEAPGNPSRAEDGQPAETCYADTLEEACDTGIRSADVYDAGGVLVARTSWSGSRLRVTHL